MPSCSGWLREQEEQGPVTSSVDADSLGLFWMLLQIQCLLDDPGGLSLSSSLCSSKPHFQQLFCPPALPVEHESWGNIEQDLPRGASWVAAAGPLQSHP